MKQKWHKIGGCTIAPLPDQNLSESPRPKWYMVMTEQGALSDPKRCPRFFSLREAQEYIDWRRMNGRRLQYSGDGQMTA